MSEWMPIETAPAGVLVQTKIDDAKGERNLQPLRRRGNLWFCVDGDGNDTMYVYYSPTHWQPFPAPPKENNHE
ncbi:DUF551 domain-containing protein [Achromobacter xylosoxidans]|uniref:DUF551 domain-containing protein n=1 Tax=Alcaligenes xylosoxydans xylosoxydans TaxID=85698 RepID=UPI0038FC9DB6